MANSVIEFNNVGKEPEHSVMISIVGGPISGEKKIPILKLVRQTTERRKATADLCGHSETLTSRLIKVM
jgi:hypothetical protein